MGGPERQGGGGKRKSSSFVGKIQRGTWSARCGYIAEIE